MLLSIIVSCSFQAFILSGVSWIYHLGLIIVAHAVFGVQSVSSQQNRDLESSEGREIEAVLDPEVLDSRRRGCGAQWLPGELPEAGLLCSWSRSPSELISPQCFPAGSGRTDNQRRGRGWVSASSYFCCWFLLFRVLFGLFCLVILGVLAFQNSLGYIDAEAFSWACQNAGNPSWMWLSADPAEPVEQLTSVEPPGWLLACTWGQVWLMPAQYGSGNPRSRACETAAQFACFPQVRVKLPYLSGLF